MNPTMRPLSAEDLPLQSIRMTDSALICHAGLVTPRVLDAPLFEIDDVSIYRTCLVAPAGPKYDISTARRDRGVGLPEVPVIVKSVSLSVTLDTGSFGTDTYDFVLQGPAGIVITYDDHFRRVVDIPGRGMGTPIG